MKGKIAFVLGAAVGYVLGTRAGRERYEQIKQGAASLWNTAPVQRGVGVVRDAAQVRVDQVKDSVIRAGKGAVAAMLRDDSNPAQSRSGAQGSGAAESSRAPSAADGSAASAAASAAASSAADEASSQSGKSGQK